MWSTQFSMNEIPKKDIHLGFVMLQVELFLGIRQVIPLMNSSNHYASLGSLSSSDSATTLACEDFSKSGPRALFCELTSSRYVLTENWLNPKVNPQRLAQRANSAPAFLWQQLRSASLATWLRSRREPRIPIRPMQMIGVQQTFKQNESFLLWSFVPPKFLMDFILT